MNLSSIWNGITVLQKGKEVANPEAWKNAAMAATVVTGFLVQLVPWLHGMWPDIVPDLRETEIAVVAQGIVTGVLWFAAIAHAVSSKRVGIGSAPTTDQDARDAGVGS